MGKGGADRAKKGKKDAQKKVGNALNAGCQQSTVHLEIITKMTQNRFM